MNAVVVERKWNRTTNLHEMRTRRTHKPDPIVVETTYRTTHLDGCPRIDGGEIVATGTVEDMLDFEPWPCDCVMEMRVDNVPAHTPPARPALPVSEKQAAFLRSLGFDGDISTLTGGREGTASAMIDSLLAAKAAAPAPAPAPAAAEVEVPAGLDIMDRPNRYAGRCELCGGQVAENAGRLAKRNGKWAVVHADGQCSAAPAAAPAPASKPLADVPAGHYAIPSTGDNDLVFYRIDRPTEGNYAGRTFVKMIVGGHPDQNVRRDHVPGILDRIVEAGIAHSAALYGQEIGRCYRCNRHLTDETSRSLGIGPECRKHA